jgi:hypothetical protein
MTMTSAIQELIEIAAKIKDLTNSKEHYSTLGKARGLPGDYMRAVNGLRVDSSSSYGNRVSDHQQALADKLKSRMVEEERDRGERERDALLARYAAMLESLRAALPAIAAAASIEIGGIARALAAEAKKGAR